MNQCCFCFEFSSEESRIALKCTVFRAVDMPRVESQGSTTRTKDCGSLLFPIKSKEMFLRAKGDSWMSSFPPTCCPKARSETISQLLISGLSDWRGSSAKQLLAPASDIAAFFALMLCFVQIVQQKTAIGRCHIILWEDLVGISAVLLTFH